MRRCERCGIDLTGDLIVTDLNLAKGGATISGVTSTGGDVCLEVTQGDLVLASNVTGVNRVGLAAGNDIAVNGGVASAGGS